MSQTTGSATISSQATTALTSAFSNPGNEWDRRTNSSATTFSHASLQSDLEGLSPAQTITALQEIAEDVHDLDPNDENIAFYLKTIFEVGLNTVIHLSKTTRLALEAHSNLPPIKFHREYNRLQDRCDQAFTTAKSQLQILVEKSKNPDIFVEDTETISSEPKATPFDQEDWSMDVEELERLKPRQKELTDRWMGLVVPVLQAFQQVQDLHEERRTLRAQIFIDLIPEDDEDSAWGSTTESYYSPDSLHSTFANTPASPKDEKFWSAMTESTTNSPTSSVE